MKYCDECDKKYPDVENFCEICGNKLKDYVKPKEDVKEKPKPRTKSTASSNLQKIPQNTISVIGAVAVILIAFIFIGGGSNITGAATRTTSTTICTYTQEPYQEQEPYQTPIGYSVISSNLEEKWNTELGFYNVYTIQIANTDDYSGTFSVKFDLTTSKPRILTETRSQNIQSHNSGTLQAVFDTDSGEKVKGSHAITPPTKTTYRTVTKYRTLQKCM